MASATGRGRIRCRRAYCRWRAIHENRDVVLEHTAIEIAAATQTSDATVVRAIQALGFVTRPETDDGALVWADGNLGGKDEYHGRGAVV
jgi:hypothetical protein